MKKVGIITLTKNANYGNVLQNIAMQKIVNELGFEAETILNLTNSPLFNKKNFSFANLVKWMLNYNGYRENEKRNENFRKCCSKNLQYSEVTYNNGRFSKEPTGYEYFITCVSTGVEQSFLTILSPLSSLTEIEENSVK